MAPILPPDHKPVPSPLDDLKILAPATVATFTLYGLCPASVGHPLHEPVVGMIQASPQADDPERQDYSEPRSFSVERGVQSTVAPTPFVPMNWPVPQRRPSTVHLMSAGSTNAALLYSGDTSSALDWLPTFPSSTGR